MSTVWGDGPLRGAMALILAAAVLVAPFIGLLPAFALQVLGGGAAETSLLVSTQGAGAVGAALLVGSITARVGAPRTLATAALALGPAALLFWLAPSLRLAAPAVLALGACYFVLVNGLHAFCQGRVPRRLQGRISSLLSACLSGGYALGVAALGWMGDAVGLRVSAAGAALLFTALLLLAWQATAGALAATGKGAA